MPESRVNLEVLNGGEGGRRGGSCSFLVCRYVFKISSSSSYISRSSGRVKHSRSRSHHISKSVRLCLCLRVICRRLKGNLVVVVVVVVVDDDDDDDDDQMKSNHQLYYSKTERYEVQQLTRRTSRHAGQVQPTAGFNTGK